MPAEVGPRRRDLESKAKALLAAQAALEKQAERVVVLDLRRLSAVTDFFVVCTAGSARQLTALKEYIEAILAQQGVPVWHTEGLSEARPQGGLAREFQWVLMDCGEIVVHLLDEPARAFYRLEELWADAPRVPLGEGAAAWTPPDKPAASSGRAPGATS